MLFSTFTMINREFGLSAENYFMSMCNKKGIPYTIINSWVDFSIQNVPIDVKGCQISVKFSNRKRDNQQYKIGKFQFTKEQINKECYCALFTRFDKDFLFIGIIKLNKKDKVKISLHKVRERKLISLEQFYEITNKEKNKNVKK